MESRSWLWGLLCALAAAALACSADEAQLEPKPTQSAAPAVEQEQEALAEPPPEMNQREAADQPAAMPEEDSEALPPAQRQAIQQSAYGALDAVAPPRTSAPPRGVFTEGVPLLPAALGEADEYGWSAVIDDNIIAVGAPLHDLIAEDAGAVYIFERRSGEWVETAKLLPPYGESLGWFGRWLALQAGRLVIGAPYEDVNPIVGDTPIVDVGAAYVYEQVDGQWRRTATLLPEPLLPGASFGWSVAVDGDRIAVSAWSDTVEDELVGAVYIFRESKGAWRLEARIVPPDPQPIHQFGRDIELQDNVLIVGAPGDDETAPDAGAVYVYHQFDFAWNFAGKYRALDGSEGDAFGSQVALSLPRFAASAHGHDAAQADAGAVFIWRLDDQWEFEAQIIASDSAVADWFGYAPALNGERLIVGAPHRSDPDTGLYRTGAAYIFERIEGEWVELGVIGPVDPVLAGEKAEFGWAADLDGDTIVIGSWLADAAEGKDAGAAAVYTLEAGQP